MSRESKLIQIKRDKLDIIALKKGAVKYCDPIQATVKDFKPIEDTTKGILPHDEPHVIYRTLIANTYNYMDGHDDVHLNGIFAKSIAETKKIFLLHDHKFEVVAQIGSIISAYEQSGRFQDFGLNIQKDTQALLLDVAIERVKNQLVFDAYSRKEIEQHSVGMQYVKIDLAIDDSTDKEGFALYHKLLPIIGNAEEVEAQGYFFAVSEAKLRETSAVLMGSNPLTGIYNQNQQNQSNDEIEQMFDKMKKNIENKDFYINLCNEYCDTFKVKEPLNDTPIVQKPSIYQVLKKIN
jgi:hypothetical protein